MQYKLDNTKAKQLQLSNDAFYYLMYGEDPLDDDNLDEAKEIAAMFPFGFSISDWEYVEGENDLIEATFIPYIEDDVKYDGWMDYLAKNWIFKYRMTSTTTAHIHIDNEVTGEVHADFECTVVKYKNKPWVVYNSNGDASMLSDYSNCCQIPLWRCNKY